MRQRVRVPAVGSGAAVLAVLAWVDLGFLNLPSMTALVLLGEAVLLAGAAWLVHRQATARRHGLAAGLGMLAAVVSVLVTGFIAETVPQREPGLVALVALLMIVAVLCRRLPGRRLPLVLVVLIAIVYMDHRLPVLVSSVPFGNVYGWLAVAGAAFAGWGFSQRTEDRRRDAAVEQVRQAERLELARDLHDHVAHYVTAMIVVAQAGEQLAERDPAHAARLFGDLERTGQEGLVAMSRMVRLLRRADQPGTDPTPEPTVVRTLDTVRTLVDRFADGTTRAELHLGVGVDEQCWSPELAKSVQRLVQEGLTNVRKHARAATSVRVSIEHTDGRLVVRIRDDGARGGRGRFRTSGFGMVGLDERVTALGGELTGGPCDGGGWLLSASLPGPAATATAAR